MALHAAAHAHTFARNALVADETLPIVRQLSPGSASDDPAGQKLMEKVPKALGEDKPLTMDKAYEGDACRAKAVECGMLPVVLPKKNRVKPWRYCKKLYKQRHM